jgi:hypothetical protein
MVNGEVALLKPTSLVTTSLWRVGLLARFVQEFLARLALEGAMCVIPGWGFPRVVIPGGTRSLQPFPRSPRIWHPPRVQALISAGRGNAVAT